MIVGDPCFSACFDHFCCNFIAPWTLSIFQAVYCPLNKKPTNQKTVFNLPATWQSGKWNGRPIDHAGFVYVCAWSAPKLEKWKPILRGFIFILFSSQSTFILDGLMLTFHCSTWCAIPCSSQGIASDNREEVIILDLYDSSTSTAIKKCKFKFFPTPKCQGVFFMGF